MSKLIFHAFIIVSLLTVAINCTRPKECELPSEGGPCRGMFLSYYFNTVTNQCENFIYGGCNGNANRFETKELCVAKCIENNLNNDIIHED